MDSGVTEEPCVRWGSKFPPSPPKKGDGDFGEHIPWIYPIYFVDFVIVLLF